jgi:Multidrug resistance efflux pump
MNKKLIAAIILVTAIVMSGCTSSKTDNNRYTAVVEADSFLISSQVSGQVTDVFIKEGDEIKIGAKIAQIDSKAYQLNKSIAEGSLKTAKAKENQLPDRASDDKKDEIKGVVEAATAQVKLSQLQIDNCSIKSLNSGVITNVYVSRGEIVSAGFNIAKAYDLSNEYIKVYIEESKREGAVLNRELNIYVNDNKIIKGKISYISPESEFTPKNTETKYDKEKTVFMLKLKINESDKVYPGMMVDVEFN